MQTLGFSGGAEPEISRQCKTLKTQLLLFFFISIFFFSSKHLTPFSNFQAFRGMPPWSGNIKHPNPGQYNHELLFNLSRRKVPDRQLAPKHLYLAPK